MVYITGDTHGDFNRFSSKKFTEGKNLTDKDYLIICGDFGGIWTLKGESPEERYWLNWLNDKPYTILFVDGNHENFDRLYEYPRKKWHGGMVHQIRPKVLHLMRGYVFNIEGKKFFAFGGAKSYDIKDGVLEFDDYQDAAQLITEYNRRTANGELLRINHLSWWDKELPTRTEMKRGINNLSKVDLNVDFVIAHSLPLSVLKTLYTDSYPDTVTRYFDRLIKEHHLSFKEWHCGHYHMERILLNKFHIHYKEIHKIL